MALVMVCRQGHHLPIIALLAIGIHLRQEKLFGTQENETTRQSIAEQIAVLSLANKGDDGYVTIIEGGETVDDDMISAFNKHVIRQKCMILSFALNLALKNMNKWTWTKCCLWAIHAAE
jgi:hypothetical protein